MGEKRRKRGKEEKEEALEGKIGRSKCGPMGKSAAADALFLNATEKEESRRMKLALLRSKPQVWVHAGEGSRAVKRRHGKKGSPAEIQTGRGKKRREAKEWRRAGEKGSRVREEQKRREVRRKRGWRRRRGRGIRGATSRRGRSRRSASKVVARRCGAHEERCVPVWHARNPCSSEEGQNSGEVCADSCQSGQNHRSDPVEGLVQTRRRFSGSSESEASS